MARRTLASRTVVPQAAKGVALAVTSSKHMPKAKRYKTAVLSCHLAVRFARADTKAGHLLLPNPKDTFIEYTVASVTWLSVCVVNSCATSLNF